MGLERNERRPRPNHNAVTTSLDEIEHSDMILRAWLLTYQTNAVGQEASLRALELAHNALATLTEAAKGGR